MKKFINIYLFGYVFVNTSNSSTSFKIGKGLRYKDSSGILYVSIVSFDDGGGNSKGGKDWGIFKCGSTKDFLVLFVMENFCRRYFA